MDAPTGVTQEEGHTGFLIARRIQPSISLVDREVDLLCTWYPRSNRSPLVGHGVKKNPSSFDCAEIRTYAPL